MSTATKVSFMSARYHFLFSLDISPSISVVDTSFKGFSTGTYLAGGLLPCLEDCLRLLFARMRIGTTPYDPDVFITVVAQGSPSGPLQVLQQSVLVTAETLQEVLCEIQIKFDLLLCEHSAALQRAAVEAARVKSRAGARRPQGRGQARLGGRKSPERPADATSQNDLDSTLRSCLLMLSAGSVPEATREVIIITDGVMCSKCSTLQFDGVLMHFNELDVGLQIVQVGGGFAPWSALGMCSDLDQLHFLANSTPGGTCVQDHHISSMLREAAPDDKMAAAVAGVLAEAGEAFVGTVRVGGPGKQERPQSNPHYEVNQLQQMWMWRVSPLSRTPHTGWRNYSRGSFLSSLADAGSPQEDPDQRYVDHLVALGCKVPPKFEIEGLDDEEGEWMPMSQGLQRRKSLGSCSNASSPMLGGMMMRSWSNSRPNLISDLGFVQSMEEQQAQFEASHYAVPGNETQSQLYDDKEYVLRSVSLAYLVECRVREGFQLREWSVKPRIGHSGEDIVEIEFGLNFRLMFGIYYLMAVHGTQDIKVRIQIRSPSPEYLKFRGPNRQEDLAKHQSMLDAFVTSLSVVDDLLEKFAYASQGTNNWEDLWRLSAQLESHELHRWFSTQRFEYMLGRTGAGLRDTDTALSRIFEQLDAWASTTLAPKRRYWKTLRWSALCELAAQEAGSDEAEPGFQCRCCAPDGMPLQFLSNRSLCTPPVQGVPGQPPTGANTLAPCCIVEVTQPTTDSVSILIGTIGLCPHAEHALVTQLTSLLMGTGGPLLRSPMPDGDGAPVRPPALHILGHPGVLAAITAGALPPAAAPAPQPMPLSPARDSMRHRSIVYGGYHGLPRSGLRYFAQRPVMARFKTESTACRAMEGLGDRGGSFYTFAPDWQHLKMCLPHWTWRDSFKNLHAAQIVFSIVQKMRAREGWHCLRNDDSAFCFVKQFPIQQAAGKTMKEKPAESPEDAPGGPDELRVARSLEGAFHSPASFDVVSTEEPSSFRLLPVGRADSSTDAPAGDTWQPLELTLFISEEDDEADAPTPAAPAPEQAAAGEAVAQPCCSIYYCLHIETPNKKSERRCLVATVWLDAPPGTFGPEMLKETKMQVQGPHCEGACINAGETVLLEWEEGRAILGAHVATERAYMNWPAPVELRFFSASRKLLLRMVCENSGDDRFTYASMEDGPLEVAMVEACALDGPAMISGIWVETIVTDEAPHPPGQDAEMPKEVSTYELGQLFAVALESRDAFAAAAVSFTDLLSTFTEVRRDAGPLRVQSDPGMTNMQQLRSSRGPRDVGLDTTGTEVRTHRPTKSLCGLMHSVNRRSWLTLEHAGIAPAQRNNFLRGLERLPMVHQRVEFDNQALEEGGADYAQLKPGNYFLSFSEAENRSAPAPSGQFSVIFVPTVSPQTNLLHVSIGDGNVQNLRPPPIREPLVLEAMFGAGASLAPAPPPDDDECLDPAEDEANEEALSPRSQNIKRELRTVHNRCCVEAVHQQLCSNNGQIGEADLVVAMDFCQKAFAAVHLKDIVSASASASATQKRAACDLIDSRLLTALVEKGFCVIPQGVVKDGSGVLLRCYYNPSDPTGGPYPVPPPVCFLQVKIFVKSPDSASDAGSPQAAVPGGSFATTSPCGSSSIARATSGAEFFSSAAVFQAAFDDPRDVHRLLVEVHFLGRDGGSRDGGSSGRGAYGALARPPRLQRCQMPWQNVASLEAEYPEVADRVASVSKCLSLALYAAEADLLRTVPSIEAHEVHRLRRLFVHLSDGSPALEYEVELDVPEEGAELGLDFDAACAVQERASTLVVAAAGRGMAAAWNADAATDPGAVIERGDRIVTVGAGDLRGDAGKLTAEIRDALAGSERLEKLTLRLRKPAAAQVHDVLIPIARPALYTSYAQRDLISELQQRAQCQDLSEARLVHIHNASAMQEVFLWSPPANPQHGYAACDDEGTLRALLEEAGCGLQPMPAVEEQGLGLEEEVAEDGASSSAAEEEERREDWDGDTSPSATPSASPTSPSAAPATPSAAPATPSASASSAPRLPIPVAGSRRRSPQPAFWAYLVVPKSYEGAEHTVTARLHLLFTPVFLDACVRATGLAPLPDAYVALCARTVHRAALCVNQRLLLSRMVSDLRLSEFLHQELRDESPTKPLKYDTTAADFKLGRTEEAEEDREPMKPEESTKSAPVKPAPPARNRRGAMFSSLEQEDEDEVVQRVEEEHPAFIALLPERHALDVPKQGKVSVSLVPCLHNYKIINWLGGGDTEPNKTASAKVSFQQQKTGQHNVAVSLFACRLQTRLPKAMYLLFGPGGEASDVKSWHFVRPYYEKPSPDNGGVMLSLDFHGLKAMPREITSQLEKQLDAQLEKFAIVKLQLHTLDRSQTLQMKPEVLDFLRPPGAEPGQSMLLAFPPVGEFLPYSQFVRRALLGLLEPVGEAQRPEDVVEGAPSDDRSFASQGKENAAVLRPMMRFLYKRRHTEQVITDVRQYGKRGPKRRDRVSEKLLQLQERVGDGIAYIELFFISAATGQLIQESSEVDEVAWRSPLQGPLHIRLQDGFVKREEGRFEHLDLLDAEAAVGSAAIGGYLLVDIWHRALEKERAGYLTQEILIAADQALREYRLESHFKHVEDVLNDGVEPAALSGMLADFQAGASKLMDEMPDQHLSSLLTQKPQPIPILAPSRDGAAGALDTEEGAQRASAGAAPGPAPHLPPWAFMKTVEGLHVLLSSVEVKEFDVTDACVVTLEMASAHADGGVGAPQWFDVTSPRRSLQLPSVYRESGAPEESALGPQVFLETFSSPHRRSPRFTLLWGPTMQTWSRHLRETFAQDEGRSAGCGEVDRTGVDFGFVEEVAKYDTFPRKRYRIDQHRIDRSGSALLKKHIHQEWKNADAYLEGQRLAAPFLVVTLDSSGATMRGVRIEPTLLLRIQYYLQSQFLWVWARTQLLREICCCELRQSPATALPTQLKREFPWVFKRQGAAREPAPVGDDHSTVDESVTSGIDDDPDEEPPYLLFGLTRPIAELMIASPLVPPADAQGLERVGGEGLAVTRALTGSSATGTQQAAQGSPVDNSTAQAQRQGAGGRSAVSSLVEAPPPPSSSSATQVESLHRLPPGGAAWMGQQQQPTATRSSSFSPEQIPELTLRLSDGVFWHDRDDPLDGLLDVRDVLAGEPLLSDALADSAADGCPNNALVNDPFVFFARKWLDSTDRKMCQYRRKMFMEQVMREWHRESMPIVGWVRESLDLHEAASDADERLRELADRLQQRMPRQGRLSLQDPNVFEAETLLLSLVRRCATPLNAPWVADLSMLPGTDPLCVTTMDATVQRTLRQARARAARPRPPARGARQQQQQQQRERQQPPLQGPHNAPPPAVWRRSALPENLNAAVPLLVERQRFLNTFLDAFARVCTGAEGGVAPGHWKLVYCLEGVLPWQPADTLTSSVGVPMQPQTLLLYKRLESDSTRGLLAEVVCAADNKVRVEVFVQDRRHVDAESHRLCDDFLNAVKDFTFDFQLRTFLDSYDSLSRGIVCPFLDPWLQGHVPLETCHPDTSRNCIVQGTVSKLPLGDWLALGGVEPEEGQVVLPTTVVARSLVSFLHRCAEDLGFVHAGEEQEPTLAMILLDPGFDRVIRERAESLGLLQGTREDLHGTQPPIAQGLRFLLFARPLVADTRRVRSNGVHGEFGFRYVAVLLDVAWLTPLRRESEERMEKIHRGWQTVVDEVRSCAEDALRDLAVLATLNVVSMARFNAVQRLPQLARPSDLQRMVAECRSRVDLSTEPTYCADLAELRPAMDARNLIPLLRERFPRRCAEHVAEIMGPWPWAHARPEAGSEATGTLRHMFVFAVAGTAPRFPHVVGDRHVLILHLMWDHTLGELCDAWLHSSRRLPAKPPPPPPPPTPPEQAGDNDLTLRIINTHHDATGDDAHHHFRMINRLPTVYEGAREQEGSYINSAAGSSRQSSLSDMCDEPTSEEVVPVPEIDWARAAEASDFVRSLFDLLRRLAAS